MATLLLNFPFPVDKGGPSSTTTTTTPAPSEGRSSRDFWASLVGQQEQEEEPKEKVEEEPEKLAEKGGQRKPKAFWPGAGKTKEEGEGEAPSTGSDDPDHVVLPHQGEKSISVPAPASGSLGFLRSFNPSGGKAEAKNKEDPSPPRS